MKASIRVGMFLVLALTFGAVGAGRSGVPQALAQGSSQAAQVLEKFSRGEVGAEDARQILLKMSNDEMTSFSKVALSWWRSKEVAKVRAATWSLEVLARRKEFSSAMAALILDDALRVDSKIEIDPRLEVRLLGKAGRLNATRVQSLISEIAGGKSVEDRKVEPSATRLSKLGVLIDVLTDQGVSPSLSQLESLLQSDVFEIRMHAVDWFRLSPPVSAAERSKFIENALATKPVQVRERASRALASLPEADLRAVLKVNPKLMDRACQKEKSPTIRSSCSEISKKTGTQEEAP